MWIFIGILFFCTVAQWFHAQHLQDQINLLMDLWIDQPKTAENIRAIATMELEKEFQRRLIRRHVAVARLKLRRRNRVAK